MHVTDEARYDKTEKNRPGWRRVSNCPDTFQRNNFADNRKEQGDRFTPAGQRAKDPAGIGLDQSLHPDTCYQGFCH